MLATLKDIKVIQLPYFPDPSGELVVMEGKTPVPFAIARAFVVRASTGSIRGQHAHKACSQLMTCLNGIVAIHCDDGHSVVTHTLDRMDQGLLVPPGIWAECRYQSSAAVLMVLCDRPYEIEDYIRDHAEFKKYRGIK